MAWTFVILGGVVVLFVSNRFPVELVAITAALSLYASGVLELNQALAGFSDPAVILIASLFVVSEALDATGVTTWAGQQLLRRAGASQARLVVMVMLLVALLTALISVNGAVASLLPMVVVLAVRTSTSPSRLLMPLAFGAHAGSMLALTGTPVNVVVSEAAADAGGRFFGFFEFAIVGIPLVAGTILITVLLGNRLLPTRTPRALPEDLTARARTLSRQYLRDHRIFRLTIAAAGADGRDLHALRTRMPTALELIGVQVGGDANPTEPRSVGAGDVILVRGEPDETRAWAEVEGLELAESPFVLDGRGELISRDVGVVEVVIPPRSEMVGETVFPGMVTDSGDLVVLAVQRAGEDLGPAASTLRAGDTLLVQGQWGLLEQRVDEDPDVIAVDEPGTVRRQAVPLGPRSTAAIAVLGAMVVLLATGLVPAAVAGLLAAGALVLLRVLTVEQAYRGINWTTVVLVAAMIPLSTAMTQSGAAEEMATRLVDIVGDSSPYFLLAGLFVLTAVLGQLISNMATALIMIPIAVSAASEYGISVQPVMMALTVAAATALLTPVATPANLMVMGPAGYRFGDYWKYGLPLMAMYFVVSVFLVPQIWSF